MGNCCKTASSMEWDGEDWSSLKSRNNNTTTKKTITTRLSSNNDNHGLLALGEMQKEKLLQRASPDADGRVKLRISKKELEELFLGSGIIKSSSTQGGGASAEQVLLRLMNRANSNKPHGPWKPMLDGIPESPN